VGANIPFIESTGAQYFGIEGSQSAVERAKSRFPHLVDSLICGDFTERRFATNVDIIIDRSSVTHNETLDIERTLRLCAQSMSPQGVYLGVDWFSDQHEDAQRGLQLDQWTRHCIPSGQFKGLGAVHFSSIQHLHNIFSNAGLEIVSLESKVRHRIVPEPSCHATFDLVAMQHALPTFALHDGN